MGAGIALEFLRKYWVYVVVALAVATWHGAVFYAGGRAPRAELEKERAEHRAQVAALKAEQKLDKEASDALITQKDIEHEQHVGRINADWTVYLGSLCPRGVDARGVCLGPVVRPVAEPVRVAAEVCNDKAGNDRISEALQGYRREIGRILQQERDDRERIVAEERRGAGALLATCERQADALVNLQDVWAGERAINATPPGPPTPGRID